MRQGALLLLSSFCSYFLPKLSFVENHYSVAGMVHSLLYLINNFKTSLHMFFLLLLSLQFDFKILINFFGANVTPVTYFTSFAIVIYHKLQRFVENAINNSKLSFCLKAF